MGAERTIVLLVQPDDDNRQMYAEYLRHHGFAVVACADGDEALCVAPVADVIVTGVRLLGRINGIQLIARLRCDERTARTPIVVLTAFATPAYRAYAEVAGCDCFLPMPCLPEALMQELRQLLPQQERPPQPPAVAVRRAGAGAP